MLTLAFLKIIVIPPVPWSCDGKGSTATVSTQPQTLLVDELYRRVSFSAVPHFLTNKQTIKSTFYFMTYSYALETTCLGAQERILTLREVHAPFSYPPLPRQVLLLMAVYSTARAPILTAPTCKHLA